MARPIKQGLEYFPTDTDTYSDRKIRRLLKEFSAQGYLIYDYLRCVIYRDNGYYVKFNDELCFDVADFLESGIDEDLVKRVILGCVKLELFDSNLFTIKQILTSSGIQNRYIKIKRNAVIDEEMRVMHAKTRVIDVKTPISHAESTQRKEKESKVNEIKEKETVLQKQVDELTSEQIQKFSDTAVKDKIWLEQLCIGAHIQPSEISYWIAQYNASLVGFDGASFNLTSYKRIFRGWLNNQQAKGHTVYIPKFVESEEQYPVTSWK